MSSTFPGFSQFPKENTSISNPTIQGRFPEPKTEEKLGQRLGSRIHHNKGRGRESITCVWIRIHETFVYLESLTLTTIICSLMQYPKVFPFLKIKHNQMPSGGSLVDFNFVNSLGFLLFSEHPHDSGTHGRDGRREKHRSGKSEGLSSSSCRVPRQEDLKVTISMSHLLVSSPEKWEHLLQKH